MSERDQLEFRPATEKDLPDLVALYRELANGEPNVTEEKAREIFDRILSYPDYSIYLALDAKGVVGTFALLIMDAIGDRCAPVGVVEDVVVAERSRGKGIGRAMMALAMDVCRRKGCYKLMLSSNRGREDAHRFYESLGFRRHGFSFLIDLDS